MKKTSSILLVILLIFSKYANSQIDPQNLEFGLSISPSISWAHTNTKFISSKGFGPNFGFGAKINYKLSEKYGVGLDIYIQNVSSKIHFDKVDVAKSAADTFMHSSDFNISYTFKQIDLPFLLKMRTEENNDMRFYGEFGGVLNLLLKQRADISSRELNLGSVNTADPEVGDDFRLRNTDNINTSYAYQANSLGFGIVFGAGIQYKIMSRSRIDAGLRYYAGLTDILDDDRLQATNNCLSLNIGFFF